MVVIISLVVVLFCLAPKGTLPLLVVPKLACFVLFKALNLTICIPLLLFTSVFVIAATLEVVVEVVEGVVGSRLLLVKVLLVTKVLLTPRLNFFFLFVGGGSPRSSRSLKLTWLAKEQFKYCK